MLVHMHRSLLGTSDPGTKTLKKDATYQFICNYCKTVSLFELTLFFVQLAKLEATVVLLTCSGIEACSYLPEPRNHLTSSPSYFIWHNELVGEKFHFFYWSTIHNKTKCLLRAVLQNYKRLPWSLFASPDGCCTSVSRSLESTDRHDTGNIFNDSQGEKRS